MPSQDPPVAKDTKAQKLVEDPSRINVYLGALPSANGCSSFEEGLILCLLPAQRGHGQTSEREGQPGEV
jgi:hypothetical protein